MTTITSTHTPTITPLAHAPQPPNHQHHPHKHQMILTAVSKNLQNHPKPYLFIASISSTATLLCSTKPNISLPKYLIDTGNISFLITQYKAYFSLSFIAASKNKHRQLYQVTKSENSKQALIFNTQNNIITKLNQPNTKPRKSQNSLYNKKHKKRK